MNWDLMGVASDKLFLKQPCPRNTYIIVTPYNPLDKVEYNNVKERLIVHYMDFSFFFHFRIILKARDYTITQSKHNLVCDCGVSYGMRL